MPLRVKWTSAVATAATTLLVGTMLAAALAAAEQLDATVLDMRFVKPLDEDAIRRHALQSRAIVTLEENALAGGACSGVSEVLDAAGILLPRLSIGIPDRYIDHGTREDCLVAAGLYTASVLARISQWWLPLAAAATDAAASPHQ
jgi:1-deoxy-D-xylulose-5-phosphate synthase